MSSGDVQGTLIFLWWMLGWVSGVAYFWDMDDYPAPWLTCLIIIIDGAIAGPFFALMFVIQPPDWIRKK